MIFAMWLPDQTNISDGDLDIQIVEMEPWGDINGNNAIKEHDIHISLIVLQPLSWAIQA